MLYHTHLLLENVQTHLSTHHERKWCSLKTKFVARLRYPQISILHLPIKNVQTQISEREFFKLDLSKRENNVHQKQKNCCAISILHLPIENVQTQIPEWGGEQIYGGQVPIILAWWFILPMFFGTIQIKGSAGSHIESPNLPLICGSDKYVLVLEKKSYLWSRQILTCATEEIQFAVQTILYTP